MKHGLPLHAVADDTENPLSRTGAMLADLALKRGWPLLLTQLGSLGFQPDAEAAQSIAVYQGGGRDGHQQRAHRADHLRRDRRSRFRAATPACASCWTAGVRVLAAQDDVDNPYYPFGRNDPLDVALLTAHVARLAWDDDLDTVRHMVTDWAAEAIGLQNYGLHIGARADVVLLDAPCWRDALQFQPARRAVILGGRVRAEERREVQFFLE